MNVYMYMYGVCIIVYAVLCACAHVYRLHICVSIICVYLICGVYVLCANEEFSYIFYYIGSCIAYMYIG